MLTRQVHGNISSDQRYQLGSDPAAATYAKLESIVGDRGGPPKRHAFCRCLADVAFLYMYPGDIGEWFALIRPSIMLFCLPRFVLLVIMSIWFIWKRSVCRVIIRQLFNNNNILIYIFERSTFPSSKFKIILLLATCATTCWREVRYYNKASSEGGSIVVYSLIWTVSRKKWAARKKYPYHRQLVILLCKVGLE